MAFPLLLLLEGMVLRCRSSPKVTALAAVARTSWLPNSPDIALLDCATLLRSEVQRLAPPRRRCARRPMGLYSPSCSPERVQGDHEWVRLPPMDRPVTNHEPSAGTAYRAGVSPHLPQLLRERLGAGVSKLTVRRVADPGGSPKEPIAQPLIGNVGPHAIVRR